MFEFGFLDDGSKIFVSAISEGVCTVQFERGAEMIGGYAQAICKLPTCNWTKVEGYNEYQRNFLVTYINNYGNDILAFASSKS